MYIKYSTYRKKNSLIYLFNQLNYAERYYEADVLDFIKMCPSHFANSNQGDYTIIPNDVLENARMKKEAVEEIIQETKSREHKENNQEQAKK